MSELKFLSRKHFNELTQCIHLIVAKQEETPSLNQLRQLIAKDQGYKSLQAYQAANYTAAESLPKNHIVNAQLTREDMILLTDSDCNHLRGSVTYFNALGLECDMLHDMFYPLTKLEQTYIKSERFYPNPFASGMMGYSVLYNEQKYLFLEFELNYSEDLREFDCTKSEAKAKHDALLSTLIFAAKYMCGHVMHLDIPEDEGNISGRYISGLLVPFSFAMSVADTFYEWQDFLNRLFIGLHSKQFNDENHITDKELANVYFQ